MWHTGFVLQSTWNLSGAEIKPVSSALVGGFLTIGPPEKSCGSFLIPLAFTPHVQSFGRSHWFYFQNACRPLLTISNTIILILDYCSSFLTGFSASTLASSCPTPAQGAARVSLFKSFSQSLPLFCSKPSCMHAKSLQSCLILCNAMDHIPPGSKVQGILQSRTLEWVAMPSCRGSS